MQVGDLATWVGAAGTVGALMFTAYTLRRQVDRERRADDEHRRMHAKRVRVSITVGPTAIAEVGNDSDANIYNVCVYLYDPEADSLIARSDGVTSIIPPETRLSFPLMPMGPHRELPSRVHCFAQFTDDNGYRWSRYVMGLLTEMAPEEGINQKRAEAWLVALALVGERPTEIVLTNNGRHSIRQVRILIRDKSDRRRLVSVSDTVQEIVPPGSAHRFAMISIDPGASEPADYVCIADFIDSHGLQWNRYLRGRLEKISPDPPLDRRKASRKMVANWLAALAERRRRLIRPRGTPDE